MLRTVETGTNQVDIDIVDVWPNRPIGDSKLLPEKRYTKTNVQKFYTGEHPLLASGPIGPVTVQSSAPANIGDVGF